MIPEEVKQKVRTKAQTTYGDETPFQHGQQATFIDGAEFGYNLSSGRIEDLENKNAKLMILLEKYFKESAQPSPGFFKESELADGWRRYKVLNDIK